MKQMQLRISIICKVQISSNYAAWGHEEACAVTLRGRRTTDRVRRFSIREGCMDFHALQWHYKEQNAPLRSQRTLLPQHSPSAASNSFILRVPSLPSGLLAQSRIIRAYEHGCLHTVLQCSQRFEC